MGRCCEQRFNLRRSYGADGGQHFMLLKVGLKGSDWQMLLCVFYHSLERKSSSPSQSSSASPHAEHTFPFRRKAHTRWAWSAHLLSPPAIESSVAPPCAVSLRPGPQQGGEPKLAESLAPWDLLISTVRSGSVPAAKRGPFPLGGLGELIKIREPTWGQFRKPDNNRASPPKG